MTDADASSKRAIVLFAHGARDPEWAGPVRRLADRLMARDAGVRVVTAFLEFMAPGLEAAVDGLVGEGVGEILVVPVFLAQGGHLKRDVPVLVEAAAERHRGLRIRLVAPVGEDDGVLDAMALYALGALAGSPGA